MSPPGVASDPRLKGVRAHAPTPPADWSHGLGARPVVLLYKRAPEFEDVGRWGVNRFTRLAEALDRWGADALVNGGGRGQAEESRDLPQARAPLTLIRARRRPSCWSGAPRRGPPRAAEPLRLRT